MYVVMFGNLNDGYKPVGPFASFDDAATFADGPDTWIMKMDAPPAEWLTKVEELYNVSRGIEE